MRDGVFALIELGTVQSRTVEASSHAALWTSGPV